MATKIRLQRHGKKRKPFYHIVIADARAKRDGRYISKIGTYNPVTNPATIDLDVDKAVEWLQTGAQPTDTVKSILSYTGALYKNHLLKGVQKGALTEAQAEKKFEAWTAEKAAQIQAKKDGLVKGADDAKAKALAAEKAVSDKRAAEIAEKNTPPAEEVAEEEAPAAEAATEEAPAAEAATEEAPAAEAATEEAPVAEAAAEEAPAKEEE
ncbi:MAG: 30S ribosomal protein S16 [Crocinitomicaceae bacterium]